MNPSRLWLVAAALLISMSAIIGCAHHAGGGGCGCPSPGGYGGGYGGGGTYAPPGNGGGVAPYQAPRGSGLF